MQTVMLSIASGSIQLEVPIAKQQEPIHEYELAKFPACGLGGGMWRILMIMCGKALCYVRAVAAFMLLWLASTSAFAEDLTTTWRLMTTTNAPVWRGWSSMTWAASQNKLVMWGGSGAIFMDDVVGLDPVTGAWTTYDTQVNCPGNSSFLRPNGSDENGVTYDAYNDLLWIYNGGSGYRCGTTQLVGRIAGAGTTSTAIVDLTLTSDVDDYYKDWTVRFGGTSVFVTSYVAATKTLNLALPMSIAPGVPYDLFADFGSGTWSYSFATGSYHKLATPYWGYTGLIPPSRRSSGFAADGTRVVLFGGGDFLNDVYWLDLASQAYSRAIPAGLATSPPARGQFPNQFIYDSASDRFVLFGGRCYEPARCNYQGKLDDTWLYDANTNSWSNVSSAIRPPARDQAQMYFDSLNRVVVLYGGSGTGGEILNDLWTFNVSTQLWTQQTMPSPNPGGVYLGQVGYASTTNCGYLVYGNKQGATPATEIWELCLRSANVAPTASFTATPSSVTVGAAVALNGTASADTDGTLANYSWNYGDGSAVVSGAALSSTSKTYAAAGTYTVTLTVTDNLGATGVTTRTVTVTAAGGVVETVWLQDALPAGVGLGGNEPWSWVTANPVSFAGTQAHQSALASGMHQHYFLNGTTNFAVNTGDTLFAYVYLDPANLPAQVMLQWYDGSGWEHRAYWGSANQIGWGVNGTASARPMGALPAAGQWVRLDVPASQVGLEGATVKGMAFTLYGGRATWDHVGKVASGGAANVAPTASFTATPSSVTVGAVVALNGTASADTDGTLANYSWNYGDGSAVVSGAALSSTSKTYAAAGTYTVTLTVTDNLGATGVTTRTVTVTAAGGGSGVETVWLQDALPAGVGLGGNEPWSWVTANPVPFAGTQAHQSALASGVHQHYFTNGSANFPVNTGDTLFAYVYLDAANPPTEVMLQWFDGAGWEHRAYWGSSNPINWGVSGTASARPMGALPTTGQWVRLEVPASQVALEGQTVRGIAFTLYGGRATWDHVGKVAP